MTISRINRLIPAVVCLVVGTSGCRPSIASATSADSTGSTTERAQKQIVADSPLAKHQSELLDLAFATATALPLDPHIKSRARAQEVVVAACLALGQPTRAVYFAEQIPDWRKGTALADCAIFLAKRGSSEEATRYLEVAQRVSEEAPGAKTQEWRRDRIRARIAKAHLLMGDAAKAQPFEVGLVDSEAGAVALAKVRAIGDGEFAKSMVTVDEAIKAGTFDGIQVGLDMCAALFERFYGDLDKCGVLEAKVKATRSMLPMRIGIDLMQKLISSAIDHKDGAKARELLGETRTLVDTGRWTPEDHVAMSASLAKLHYRAGDPETARKSIDAALTFYRGERGKIMTIDRAGALRSLAEAYQAIGESARALEVYAIAVEDGAENPNARPRAEDLAATCCSLAVSGAAPGESLLARIHKIRGGLGTPW